MFNQSPGRDRPPPNSILHINFYSYQYKTFKLKLRTIVIGILFYGFIHNP